MWIEEQQEEKDQSWDEQTKNRFTTTIQTEFWQSDSD